MKKKNDETVAAATTIATPKAITRKQWHKMVDTLLNIKSNTTNPDLNYKCDRELMDLVDALSTRAMVVIE